jgi:hypothetical protein
MRTNVPEKLLKLADDIAAEGNVSLTRLTVLKKWFERPERLSAFALWVAQRAISRKGKTLGEGAKLFREAKAMLSDLDRFRPSLPAEQQERARSFYGRLQAFQNEYRETRWARIRTIENWNLFLVEKGMAILMNKFSQPTDGYKLAADYCQNYDPRYGNGLNGPSEGKLLEVMGWMFTVEALEDEPPEALKRKRK